MRDFRLFILLVPIALTMTTSAVAQDEEAAQSENVEERVSVLEESVEDLALLTESLRSLLDTPITTASSIEEKLSDAPATVIVITADDIRNRGYTDLLEIYQDIPGVDISTTFGDLYQRQYWRGFRKGSSNPYLFMIDGAVMNHLWFNWADIMTAVPLSNIKQIEVVYGPASSVYGPNAMMGVINVVTLNDLDEDGTSVVVRGAGGEFDTRIADLTALYKKGDFRVRLTGFLNHGNLDMDSLDNYEWTHTKYLTDETLWYDCTSNPRLCGDRLSPRKNRALSFNAYYGQTELGAAYYRVGDMYGTNYAYDKLHPQTIWVEEDYAVYLRNTTNLTEKLTSESLIMYRESNVPNESNSIERGGDEHVRYGIWQSLNNSWLFEQSFAYQPIDSLLFKLGAKYQMRYLQMAYDLPYGTPLGPDNGDDTAAGDPLADGTATVDAMGNPSVQGGFFPEVPPATHLSQNRITWVDQGVFLQSRYTLSDLLGTEDSHYLNLGVRYDHNTDFEGNLTLRGGYVGHFGPMTAKVLYGQAIQEPTARQLYGGWGGSGSATDLDPERSQTMEIYVDYVADNFSVALNPYYNILEEVIRDLEAGPINTGKSRVLGVDLHANALFDVGGVGDLRLWAYYSFLNAQEDNIDENDVVVGDREVGDLADHKVFFGLTGRFLDKHLVTTLRGRFIGPRNVVAGNPIGWETDADGVGSLYNPCSGSACPSGLGYGDGKVDGYLTLDLNLQWRDFLAPFVDAFTGVTLALDVKNLLDETYFHPGIRAANSGVTAGSRAADGTWNGSAGWSNSLLPQPGRQILVTLRVDH